MGYFSYIVLIVSGFFIGFIVAVPIGPVNLICVRRTLNYGPINGFISCLGSALADTIFAGITAFGLTAVTQIIEAFAVPLQITSGGLLIFFGAKTYFSDPIAGHVEEKRPVQESEVADILHALAGTFAIAITNPATLFGFATIFAGLSGLTAKMVTYVDTGMVVGGVLAGAVAWWFLLSTVVGLLHHSITQRTVQRINHVTGIVIALFGVGLLVYLTVHALV